MIYTHPGQPQMQVEVILASKPTNDAPPIVTLRARYPRIIHSEIMTHRVFSRNARSSRAVPVKTMLDEVRNTPFVPWHWFKNQKGMQGKIPLSPKEVKRAKELWLEPLPEVINAVIQMTHEDFALEVHKQNPNRLLEPWMWIDTLITSTQWANFLWLRNHEDAEPHLQDLARLIGRAIEQAEFQTLKPGEWHLPYITDEDHRASVAHPEWAHTSAGKARSFVPWLCKLSAARCARISYKPFDGDASYERELERYDSLVSSDRVHASPLEHQAQADHWIDPAIGYDSDALCGNLRPGWVQYRKTLPGENHV